LTGCRRSIRMEKVSIMCLTIFLIIMFVDCMWGMCRFRAGSALCTSFPEVLGPRWQGVNTTVLFVRNMVINSWDRVQKSFPVLEVIYKKNFFFQNNMFGN